MERKSRVMLNAGIRMLPNAGIVHPYAGRRGLPDLVWRFRDSGFPELRGLGPRVFLSVTVVGMRGAAGSTET